MAELPKGQKPMSFLTLPREIRNNIYQNLFVQSQDINCYRVWFTTSGRHRRRLAREGAAVPDCCGRRDYGCPTHWEARLRPHGTALLRTCRSVHDEGTEILYGRNVFAVALEQRCVFLRLFGVGERNLRLVRHVKLTAYTDYLGYYIVPPGDIGNGDRWTAKQWEFFGGEDGSRAAGWTALVSGLHTLQVAALVPNWGHHRGWPVWVDQLEHVLKVIGDGVPKDADVTVDDNRSVFLCDMVDRCFSGKRFQRARLPEGDAHYTKGRFDPVDAGDDAPRNCDGDPVPEKVLKRLPKHPTESLPFELFDEDDDENDR
ncbi:uncharacterized protein PG998_007073 [Apiospora kogelbergensis]|uniref:uncharacterized protein n=1 Tax=Apiospora kogelbergensis TaxID=1337665 RepID=UPI00312F158A